MSEKDEHMKRERIGDARKLFEIYNLMSSINLSQFS